MTLSLATVTLILLCGASPSDPVSPLKEAVAADHALAERAGLSILERGGNAVDAAVATSFALAVVRPESCGIGGGGFMVIHLVDDPRTPAPGDAVDIAIDYRERAPAAITPTTFVDLPPDASTSSGLAVAVPGTVAGLLHALEVFGTLPRDVVMAPAIEIARSGYALDAFGASSSATLRDEIASARPDAEARAFMGRFIPQDPERFEDTKVQLAELADTLGLIATQGRDGFYAGPVAEAIVVAVKSRGGVMTVEDLRGFRALEVAPIRGEALGRTIIGMPPPSSGGVAVIQSLMTIQERLDLLANVQRRAPAFLNLIAASLQLAFADRARFLCDPEFAPVRVDAMLDPARVRARALKIRNITALKADDPAVLAPLPDDAGTSHLCVVDRMGNAVSCTETVNLTFGSGIPVVRYGFFLNNEMDDFLTRPGQPNAFGLTQAEANLPGPGKRPLSSMSPTIILDNQGRVEVVVGASGGPRIISATVQVIVSVIMFYHDPQDAVDAPRIHHQWQPDTIFYETEVPIADDAIRALRDRGYTVTPTEDAAAVQCIARDVRDPKRWRTAADPRKRTPTKSD